MRIVICWSDIGSYATACWRELTAIPDLQVSIIAFQPAQKSFSTELLKGLDHRLLTTQERNDPELVKSLVRERRPDIFYISGWFHRPYLNLCYDPEFDSVRKWLGCDTPWSGTFRQQVGRFLLRRLAGRLDCVFVPGERAWQYIRRIGVPEERISRGLYCIDQRGLTPLLEQRRQQPGGWPKSFLYIGRYTGDKDLPTLLGGYAKYRTLVADPWPLGCCGAGEDEGLLRDRPGVENHGFKQPAELVEIMRQYGVFVLASSFEPWAVVISEAGAAGMPVICSNACGASVELVRSYYNGLTFGTGDADALAQKMRWMHEHWADLPEMGRRGQELAAPYSARMFALRWAEAARQPVRGKIPQTK